MLILAAILAGGFEFKVHRDMITDQVSYVAIMDRSRDSSIRFVCGAATDGRMVINFKPGKLLQDQSGGLLMPFKNRVRFGDLPPIEIEVEYAQDTILITGRDAVKFTQSAKLSQRVVFEFTDAFDATYQTNIALDGAAESIAKVESACGLQTSEQ